MSDRRRVALLAAAVLALVIAAPVLAAKPDKDDGKPGKGLGPPPHAVAIGWPHATPAPQPPPVVRPPSGPPPSTAPPAASVEPPVLVLPNTAARP